MKKKFTTRELLQEAKELFNIIIIALVIVVPFRYFVAEPYLVEGASMEPNFHTGDYLIVTKVSEISRGDVIVFTPPGERTTSWRNLIPFLDQRSKYIKRVVGLPNEEVKLENDKVFIKYVGTEDFQELDEPYLDNTRIHTWRRDILSADQYFVMGDNRGNSRDSEEFGPIEEADILGEPLLRLLPVTQVGTFPAGHDFDK